ncbi:MAG: endonuclease domain-containing protein [Burkholderiales bacterium]
MVKHALSNAKAMRSSPTDVEALLWRHLRAHRFAGVKFRRQQPIGAYIVDFVCFEQRVIIEVDGGQHLDNPEDNRRDAWLNEQGFRVLRIWNNDVFLNTEGVLERILHVVTAPLSPTPLPQWGEGL